MIEDNLLHDERLRLECLAQAVNFCMPLGASSEVVVSTAKAFEDYVFKG